MASSGETPDDGLQRTGGLKQQYARARECVADLMDAAREWWRFSTDPEMLGEDSRRHMRSCIIGGWGFVYAMKTWPHFTSGVSMYERALHVLNVFVAEALARFAIGRPACLKVDIGFASLMYSCYRVVTDGYRERIDDMSPMVHGAEIIGAFTFMHTAMTAGGTHQLVTLVWLFMVWSRGWVSDEPRISNNVLLLGLLTHVHHYIFGRAEKEKRRERSLAEQREQELHEAKVREEKQARIEHSLRIVLQQLKSPLMLLVSDLKNADVSPAVAQDTVRMLAVRIGQIWNQFTGLELQVNAAIQGIARAEDNSTVFSGGRGSLDPADDIHEDIFQEQSDANNEERPTTTHLPSSSQPDERSPPAAQAPPAARALPSAEELPGGLLLAPVPPRLGPASSAHSSSTGRSSRSRSTKRMALRNIAKVRVVFDALHPRAEMKEITISFPKEGERVGMLDFVKEEYVQRIKDWIQEATNKEVTRRLQRQPSEARESSEQDVRFDLPGFGGSAFCEAARVTLCDLTCHFEGEGEGAEGGDTDSEEEGGEAREGGGVASTGQKKEDMAGKEAEEKREAREALAQKEPEAEEEGRAAEGAAEAEEAEEAREGEEEARRAGEKQREAREEEADQEKREATDAQTIEGAEEKAKAAEAAELEEAAGAKADPEEEEEEEEEEQEEEEEKEQEQEQEEEVEEEVGLARAKTAKASREAQEEEDQVGVEEEEDEEEEAEEEEEDEEELGELEGVTGVVELSGLTLLSVSERRPRFRPTALRSIGEEEG